VTGMDSALVVAAGIAGVGLLLTLAFLPSRRAILLTGGGDAMHVAAAAHPSAPHPVGAVADASAERGELTHAGRTEG
jgi:hypothetical protein